MGVLEAAVAFEMEEHTDSHKIKKTEDIKMQNKALVIIDIQNDITKNYKGIIDNINQAIDWAVSNDIHVVYIRHYNLSIV